MKFKPAAAAILTMILALYACSNDHEEFLNNSSSPEVKFSIASIKGFGETDDTTNTRSGLQLPRTTDTIDLGEDYMIVAETYNYPEQIFNITSTRGTPTQTPGQMKNMNIIAFNSGASSFTTTTPLLKLVKATLVGSNWNNDNSVIWPKSTDKLTFFAVSPAEADDNGINISEDGRMLTYEAPTDITKQPDICWATPIIEMTNPDNSGNHLINLSMNHCLVSVGLMAMGNFVDIKKVTLSNVFSSGKLNLQTGKWSDIGIKKTFDIGVTKTLNSVVMKDITNSDGYAMLPEQSFNNDAMLSIVFDDTKSGKTGITKTFRLKLYTGGKWQAGQMILYRMMFKGSYPLTVTPTSLLLPPTGKSMVLDYSTTSPMDITFDTDASWITGIHLDTPSKGKITINYSDLPSGSRSGNVYVSTGYTTVKVSIKQAEPKISVTPNKTPQAIVSYNGATFYAYVESSVPWKVETASGITASPSSGNAGRTQVALKVAENGSYRSNADRSITFTTNTGTPAIDVRATWTTQQKNKYPAGYYSDQVPGYPGLFVRDQWAWVWCNYEWARDTCPNDGGKVPNREEGQAMARNKYLFPSISSMDDDQAFWISESAGKNWLLGEKQYTVRGYGGVHWEYRKDLNRARCVKQM